MKWFLVTFVLMQGSQPAEPTRSQPQTSEVACLTLLADEAKKTADLLGEIPALSGNKTHTVTYACLREDMLRQDML
jgi:hypothetical protein